MKVTKLIWLIFDIIILIMSVSPEIAISNIAKWLLLFGVKENNIPPLLKDPSINYAMYILSCFIILHWINKIMPFVYGKLKKYLYKNKAVKQSSIQNDFVSMLMRDLKYSVQSYTSFCYNYNNTKSSFNLTNHIEKLVNLFKSSFFINKFSILRKTKFFLSKEEYNFLIDYYNRNNQLLSYLKNLQKKSVTDIRTRDYKNRHIYLDIYSQKGVYDPNIIASCQNEKNVILYLKELTEDAEYLIDILRSKHIA